VALVILTVLLSVLNLVGLAASVPAPAVTDPCAPAHIVLRGDVTAIHLWRQEGVEPGPGNTFTVSTGCGEFIALVDVQEVFEGKLDAKLARVRGELGERCEAPVNLEQGRYVLWADGDVSLLELRRAVALHSTAKGKDAISPVDAEALGLGALIEPIDFTPMQGFFFAPGGTEERRVKAEGWLVDHGGEYTWSHGVYLDRVINALGRRPCQAETKQNSKR